MEFAKKGNGQLFTFLDSLPLIYTRTLPKKNNNNKNNINENVMENNGILEKNPCKYEAAEQGILEQNICIYFSLSDGQSMISVRKRQYYAIIHILLLYVCV